MVVLVVCVCVCVCVFDNLMVVDLLEVVFAIFCKQLIENKHPQAWDYAFNKPLICKIGYLYGSCCTCPKTICCRFTWALYFRPQCRGQLLDARRIEFGMQK